MYIKLLPNKCKKIGWWIFIPAAIIGVFLIATDFEYLQINTTTFAIYTNVFCEGSEFFTLIKTNVTSTLVGALFIIGALLVGFSQEKLEDEYIAQLRLSSLLWAVLINYLLLLFAFLFIYGLDFIYVMFYNLFTILIIYITRFNFLLYRNKLRMNNEEYA